MRSPNSGWSSYLLIMGKQSHYRSFRDYSLYHHAVFPSDVSTESVRWFDWLAAVSRSSLCYFTQCPIWAHKTVLDEACGKNTGRVYVYNVLKRHGWSKKMPRSRHPKAADEEACEASKKLNPVRWMLDPKTRPKLSD